ncbi:MAG: hypothetical protein HBSAPP04_00430 [Ignavibacteriaceae bacterium]|nr:MAG: hypothetical protein HBSAPP04_00430 [Ignavibacteriaceae bacterium]
MKTHFFIILILVQLHYAQSDTIEVTVTLKVKPKDALVTIDGKQLSGLTKAKLTIGNHSLKVEKSGFKTHTEEIKIDSEKTSINIELLPTDPIAVIITSSPPGAELSLNGAIKGKTEKGLFLNPGSYDLKLTLQGYLPLSDKITVSSEDSTKKLNYELTKNAGALKLDVSPTNARVKINRIAVERVEIYEMVPGTYSIDIDADSYDSYSGKVKIILGEVTMEKIVLKQRTGKLQLTINPNKAVCSLSQNGVVKYTWSGLMIIDSIAEGMYELKATADGFKKYLAKVSIRKNQTTVQDIMMIPGIDPPEGFVFVDGKSFNEGGQNWSSFYIGKYEVTCGLWDSILGENRYATSGKNKPVSSITLNEILAFCNALSDYEGLERAYSWTSQGLFCDFSSSGYRLPTRSEWEYAAKGGKKSKGFKFSGSNDIEKVAWYSKNSKGKKHDVGTKNPNELGLHDMSGNVRECYLDSGSFRNHGGGAFNNPEYHCSSKSSWAQSLSIGSESIGFRLVRTK